MKNKIHSQLTTPTSSSYSLLFIIVFLLASLTVSSQTQQRKWFLNAKDVDFNIVPPNVANTPGVTVETSIANQKGTNGLNDKGNNRLFNINGVDIYSQLLTSGYQILPNTTGFYSSYLRPEIAICPKPGSCDSFYVFYAHRTYNASSGCSSYELRYYLIDPSKFNDITPEDALVEDNIALFNRPSGDNYCPTPPALALSREKLIAGTKTRQLFVLDYETAGGRVFYLRRYDITPSGVSGPITLYTHTAGFDDLHNFELELSPDGQKLAFGRSRTSTYLDAFTRQPDKDIVLYHLNTDGSLNTSLGTGGLTYIDIPHATGYQESVVGLEFNAASSRLFASVANDAIWYVSNLTGIPTVSTMNALQTKDFTYSQMELVYNNGIEYIAVAKNQSNVHVITNLNSPSPTISTNALFSNANVPENEDYPIAANNSLGKYLLCLPDQIDGDNYTGSTGGWFAPENSTKCCMNFYTPNDDGGYTPPGSGNLTWNPGSGQNPFNSTGTIIFRGDFTVAAGQNLTINNMTLRFHPGSKVIVQPNAKLTLNNTKLTGLDCNSTWEGVRLIGNRSLSQIYANQGFMSAYNNSEISHATVGLATWNLETGDINTNGGWAVCTYVNFLNNKKDIDMGSYPNPSQAKFERCSLLINNNYRYGTILDHRVQLMQVSNVKFLGCTFANDCTLPFMQAFNVNTKAGIYSIDAGFEVNNSTITTPSWASTFGSLYQGINANRLFNNVPFTANNSVFTQNQMAVLTNTSNFVVTSNTFNVGNNANFNTNTGVFVNTSSAFTVRDNTFSGFGNTISTVPVSYGTVVKNTSTTTTSFDVSIFRNTFSNLCYANQSEGRNRHISDANAPGLVYFCNNHTNDLIDIRVLRDPALGNVTNQGIRFNHFTGTTSRISVQNTFSQNAASGVVPPWYDIFIEQTGFVSSGGNFLRHLSNVEYTPASAGGNTDPQQSPTNPPNAPYVNRAPIGLAKNCSNNNPFQLNIGEMLTDNGFGGTNYEESKQNYLSAKYLLNQLIDGGDKEGLKGEIDYQWSNDAWELRTQLLARSPNLSEDVVLHAAEKNILSDALLFEVCYANVHLAKSTKFIAELKYNIPNTLPDYMLEILTTTQEPESLRKTLEQQVSTYRGEMSAAYQALASYLLQDTTDRSALLKELWQDVPLKEAKLDLAEYLNAKGNASEASAALSSFESIAYSEGIDVSQVSEFYNFLFSKQNNYNALSETDINYLLSIALDSTHQFHVRANAILQGTGVKEYDVQPLQYEMPSYKTEPTQAKLQNSNTEQQAIVKVYPNPAHQYLSIEYQCFATPGNLTLEIMDNTGKTVIAKQLLQSKSHTGIENIEVNTLAKGMYFLALKDGTQILSTNTFTKSK